MSAKTTMKEYYTYAYLREDKTPYYIGKGKELRIYSNHYREKRNCVAVPKDKNRIIYLKRNLSEQEAFRHEIYMISVYGRKDIGTGILRNRTNGGEGSTGKVVSVDTKKKISEYQKGQVRSEKTRQRMSEAQKGIGCRDYRIIFDDGRVKLVKGLKPWCINNGYDYSCISRLRSGAYSKHKDIVKVEKLNKP